MVNQLGVRVCAALTIAFGVAGVLTQDLRYLIPIAVAHLVAWFFVVRQWRANRREFGWMAGHLGGRRNA